MSGKYDYFVVFAEMRTGSNLLESHLNSLAEIECHGEAFNPHFIGYPKRDDLLGMTLNERDKAPKKLLDVMKNQPGVLAGFRFFNDHDPRVLEQCLDDPRCAKIVLTRNPLDSYVSLKIARATGQWKLTNVKRRKDELAAFEVAEFEQYLGLIQTFQQRLLNSLQITGQSAFYLSYEDLQDLDVINGLAQFLGVPDRLEKFDGSLKKQNPSPLREKVANYDEMKQALSKLDYFGLSRIPNFEPRRGPAVPSFITGVNAPLLYMPVRSGVEKQVRHWLAALDGADPDALPTGMNQKQLRQWKTAHVGHRSFTVLRHPVARAHAVFCSKILSVQPGAFSEIRKKLRNFYKLPIPGRIPHDDYHLDGHRAAFKAFLEFLKANLSGQTNIRVDPHWATQNAVLQGMSNFAFPDKVYREDELETELPALSEALGYGRQAFVSRSEPDTPYGLAAIYDAEIESLVNTIYQRDYVMFGFDRWK
ncbi:sulfotransferase family 2 domain-containing protein [Roseovarius sp. EL26]|uniref:sulfotransferase family 2 domain-containing protein n=1 Tax=Roseovarius sp. EL26 TaxID=2126672 RepID=UPI000EA3E74B|nr:sulfotransferase family 2 domain-containing protein [Roseovarius sp. EL26]